MSAFFNRFPYTNLNDINLDWIIKRVKKLGEDFAGQASDIAYAVLTANHASATATSARNAAQIAQNDAINALERANSVQGIAANALAVAQDASDTAENAQSVAEGIAGTAAQAVTIAQGASETAADALTAAQTATETAQGAVVQAQTATALANNAAQSAQTAINTADAALTIASSAGGLNFTDTASGDIAEFPDGMALPAINVTAEIKPNQDLHGYANPWPAGGGVNIWDEEWEVGTINSSGQPASSTTSIRCKNFIPVTPGESILYYNGSLISQAPWYYDENKDFLSRSTRYLSNGNILTVPDGVYYIKFALPASYGTTYLHDIAWNYPSTVTTYSPYANICPISGYTEANIAVSPTTDAQDGIVYIVVFGAAGTVYGGMLDVTTGVLTVAWELTTINNELWTYNQSSGQFSTSTNAPLQSKRKPGRTNLKSSAYLTTNATSSESAPDYSLRGNSSVSQIYVKDTRFTSVPSWKAVMGDTQIVYELAEPQTYQLTPTDIKLLFGNNCVWNDTNGVTIVEYHADPQKWIEKKLIEIQALTLEN